MACGDLWEISICDPEHFVVGHGGFSLVATATRRRQPNANDLDSPVFCRTDPLLEGMVSLELAVVVVDEGGHIVLVESLHRRDRLDAEPLLDGGLAGNSIDHDRYLDHLTQWTLDE